MCKRRNESSRTSVYWKFGKRVCQSCIHINTIKESAIKFAFDVDDLSHLEFEHLPPMEDLTGSFLHRSTDKHYWLPDLVKVFGNDIK